MPLTHYIVEVGPAGSPTTLPQDAVIEVSGSLDLARAENQNPLAFGDASDMNCTVTIKREYLPYPWRFARVRVRFQVDATIVTQFVGVITDYSGDEDTVELRCEGFAVLIRRCRAYSPLFLNRPAATRTTASSIEDPSNPAYAAGLMNWSFWTAGGRPLLQAALYPSATFYYHLDRSILVVDVGWIAGNDAWAECSKLALASGGMLYQDRDGTVRYRQPLTLADPAPGAHLNEQVYGEIREQASSVQTIDRIVVPYVPRRIPVSQEILKDDQARLLEPGASVSVPLEPQWPIYSSPAPTITVKAADYRGNAVSPTVSATISAQRIDLLITNSASYPILLYQITVSGRPVQPGERQTLSAGFGDDSNSLTLQDNEYIQNASHALRLAQLYLAFYAPRSIYTLSNCPYDPARNVGDVVLLSNVRLGLTAVSCLILSVRHSETGLLNEYVVAPVNDLPRRSQMFIVGQSYASADVRKLSY